MNKKQMLQYYTNDLYQTLQLHHDETEFWFDAVTGEIVLRLDHERLRSDEDDEDGMTIRTVYVVNANTEIAGSMKDVIPEIIGRTYYCNGCWISINSQDNVICYFEPNYKNQYFCFNYSEDPNLNTDNMTFKLI